MNIKLRSSLILSVLCSACALFADRNPVKVLKTFEHRAYVYSRDFSCTASQQTIPTTAAFNQKSHEKFRFVENLNHYDKPYIVQDHQDPTGKVLCAQIEALKESDADFPVRLKGFIAESIEKHENGTCCRLLSETISFKLRELTFSSTTQLALQMVPC